jgi:hypothetical protein
VYELIKRKLGHGQPYSTRNKKSPATFGCGAFLLLQRIGTAHVGQMMLFSKVHPLKMKTMCWNTFNVQAAYPTAVNKNRNASFTPNLAQKKADAAQQIRTTLISKVTTHVKKGFLRKTLFK